MPKASQYRKEIPEPPLAQQILEGLTQREVAVVFDLILALKDRRKIKGAPRKASANPPDRNAEDIEIRLWLLIELIQSFMDLYDQDDEQLVDHIGAWFSKLDYKPSESRPTLSFPANTWNMFEGLSSKQWYTLTRLLSFLKEQDILMKAKEIESEN